MARAGAAAWLDEAEAILSKPITAFVKDIRDRDLAAFYLLLGIQEAIDVAAHWVADAGWGPPDDASSTFDVLADHDVIDRTLAEALHRAVGLRNRIAHGYARIDHARLHAEATELSQSKHERRNFSDTTIAAEKTVLSAFCFVFGPLAADSTQ